MAEPSLDSGDFEEVLVRLTAYAYRLFGCFREQGIERVLNGGEGGESPEDLAMATVLKFLNPEDHTVQWNTDKGGPITQKGLLAFLKKVLYQDFLDVKRKGKYRRCDYLTTGASTDGDGAQELTLDDFVSKLEAPDLLAIRRQQHERIIQHFEQWPELVDLVKLQLHPDGCQEFSNKDLAVLLDTTVADVENRKKRIQRVPLRLDLLGFAPKTKATAGKAE